MGVMECRRAGCDQIMCDVLLFSKYYICDYCYADLLETKKTWDGVAVRDVSDLVMKFLDTKKSVSGRPHLSTDPEDVEREFNSIVSRAGD